MASSELLSVLFFTSQLFLFVTLSHSSQYGIAAEPDPPVMSHKIHTKSEKVTMSLYYESLCPYCGSFIVDPVNHVLGTDLMTILNLRLVPWGNAVLAPNTTIKCQGEDECYLNIIHACAINLWPDLKRHFNFIKCIESQYVVRPGNETEQSWEACANKLKLPAKPIKECYDSVRGKELVLQYQNETDHLNPPHEYVPWVVVNNVPLQEDYMNFIDYVCKAFKGKPLHKTCNSHPTYTIKKENSIQSVCHGEATSPASSVKHEMKMEPPV